MALNQLNIFSLFILDGFFIGFAFDIFRIIRKSFKTTNFIINVEDTIFWLIVGISIIFLMYKFTRRSY